MIDSIDSKRCTGCKMCSDLCNANAIFFQVNKEGFWYPRVNEEKCIKCGVCVKKCPELNKVLFNNALEPDVFAAWTLDDTIRFESTSGGVYYEFGRKFIEENGIIVGCVYSPDKKSALHVAGSTIADLKKIMGSKYFQSDTEGIYEVVASYLKQDRKVLFCGTPCQIAALKAFVGKIPEGLYLIDFICKGINSPKAFKAYMEELEENYDSSILKVNLKSKKTGWESLATNVVFDNGQEYHKDRYTDWWILGYTCGNLFMRETCQYCQYKGVPRLSDVTLGDFWGIENCSIKDKKNGVSVVFINSEKGKLLYRSIIQRIHSEKRSMSEVLKGNPYLFDQAYQKGNRKKFFELLDTVTFNEAVKKTYTETSIQKFKRYIKVILKKYFGREKW
ncbi:Coenzyme F420 hydrogenase/dehydrogenase, beta subunit C-terminal domain [Eubacterium maltosivorans]|uniref:Coenzyme F420 hydrogenase/dehydrogenase, beta subunit C-terminal domain n=1 Tax=Eubacterium maltosivorans TaxID=2041044 RepID=UPI0018A026DD|nr:Coenzyme F420 hydrogenase/dehydrogenase, beta subunit C-terminal domain [Eubacterium maltosivorans]